MIYPLTDKRTRYSLLLTLALIVALAVVVFLKKEAPPEVARLLPECDAIIYMNLKPIRSATHFDREWNMRPVEKSFEYQHFIDSTGIVFERDLDSVAFALHRMADPNGPNGPVAYSEVFEGRFNGSKLATYLGSVAIAKENYAGHDVYTVPVALVQVPSKDGGSAQTVRLLRVAQLGYDTIAASNMPTPEQLHSILDRYRASALPFSGSSLLNERYHDVPLLSSVWALGHVGLPFSEKGKVKAFGLQLPLPEDTTFVASLRFTTALRLRIDELVPSQADAEQSARAMTSLLQLFRSIENLQTQLVSGNQKQPNSGEIATKDLLNSVKIVAQKDRAVLTATVPLDIVRRLTSASVDTAPDSH